MTDAGPPDGAMAARGIRRRLRERLLGAVLAVTSVLLVLGAAEVGVRVLGMDPADQAVRPLAAAATKLRPNARDYEPALDQRALVEVRTNRFAMRDWEHRGGEDIRVLGLGDSFTFGFGVELEETYLSVAERAIWARAPSSDVAVYKLGMNGTSQRIQLDALRAHWDAVRPRLVVVGFSEDTDIEENVVQDPNVGRLLEGERDVSLSPAVARSYLESRSALVRFYRARKLRGELQEQVAAVDAALRSWGGPVTDFESLVRAGWQRRFIDSFGDKLEADFRVTELALDELRRFVGERGAELALFLVRSRYSVDPEAWKGAVRNHCGAEPAAVHATCGRLDPAHTTERLRKYAERHGLLYVDPGPRLREAHASGRVVYFRPPEIHWTREGHEVAGEVLAEALARHLRLPFEAGQPRAPRKPRIFGAFVGLFADTAPKSTAFIPTLAGEVSRARAQRLLWADETGIDFLVFPVTRQGDTWTMEQEARALWEQVVSQRRDGLTRVGVALAPRPSDSAGAETELPGLDDLHERFIAPAGEAYARACGRPILAVVADRMRTDPRFSFLPSRTAVLGPAGSTRCGEERSSGVPSCPATANVRWLCPHEILEGRGLPGDPDVVLAPSFEAIEPRPPLARLTSVLVGDAVRRWKTGEPEPRAPAPRILEHYRTFLPITASETTARAVTVVAGAPAFRCTGCFPVEKGPDGSYAWTTDRAAIEIHGLSPSGRYRISMRIKDAGAASQVTLTPELGTADTVPIREGSVVWSRQLVAGADGTLRWALEASSFRPAERNPASTDERLLGVAIEAIEVVPE